MEVELHQDPRFVDLLICNMSNCSESAEASLERIQRWVIEDLKGIETVFDEKMRELQAGAHWRKTITDRVQWLNVAVCAGFTVLLAGLTYWAYRTNRRRLWAFALYTVGVPYITWRVLPWTYHHEGTIASSANWNLNQPKIDRLKAAKKNWDAVLGFLNTHLETKNGQILLEQAAEQLRDDPATVVSRLCFPEDHCTLVAGRDRYHPLIACILLWKTVRDLVTGDQSDLKQVKRAGQAIGRALADRTDSSALVHQTVVKLVGHLRKTDELSKERLFSRATSWDDCPESAALIEKLRVTLTEFSTKDESLVDS